jgi:hypothetical protein
MAARQSDQAALLAQVQILVVCEQLARQGGHAGLRRNPHERYSILRDGGAPAADVAGI